MNAFMGASVEPTNSVNSVPPVPPSHAQGSACGEPTYQKSMPCPSLLKSGSVRDSPTKIEFEVPSETSGKRTLLQA